MNICLSAISLDSWSPVSILQLKLLGHVLVIVVAVESMTALRSTHAVLGCRELLVHQPTTLPLISVYTLALVLWRHLDSAGQRELAQVLLLLLDQVVLLWSKD